MNLGKKKSLASRTFNVGKKRIKFVTSRLDEIKEAITKQDIHGLRNEGAIIIKEISGTKTNVKRTRKRGVGKIKKKVNKSKQEYVKMTRKLRAYTQEVFKRGGVSREEKIEIRKRIRNRKFKSKANLKAYIGGLKK